MATETVETETESAIFVAVADMPAAVKALLDAGRISFKDDVLAVSAETSPNGKRLEAPFPVIVLKDPRDTDAVSIICGSVERANARAMSGLNNARRLQARLDLVDANRGPEYAYIKQARAILKGIADGVKAPKRYRDLDESQLVRVLFEEANEE